MLKINERISELKETIDYAHNEQLGKYDRKSDNSIAFSALAVFTSSIFFSFIYPIGFFFEWWNFNLLLFVTSIMIWTIVIALDNANKGDRKIISMQLHKQNLLILELKKDTDKQIEMIQNDLKKLLNKYITSTWRES